MQNSPNSKKEQWTGIVPSVFLKNKEQRTEVVSDKPKEKQQMENAADDERNLAGILFVGSSVLFYFGFELLKENKYIDWAFPLCLIILAVICFIPAVAILSKSMPNRALAWIDKLAGFLKISLAQLGMIVICIPLAITTRAASGNLETMTNPWIAISAWVGAITLALLAGWKNESSARPLLRTTLYSLGGVFLLAFLPRIIFPATIPVFLTGDEGSSGLTASLFASGKANNIFITSWYAFPALYFTIPGFFIQILGQDVTALRISSAIPGALTVVCVFWLLKTAYNDRTAWIGALFLSFLHFHVHFSRIGLNNIWDGLWFTVAVGALWYAWTYERRNAYLLAGLALGLSQYFYSSGRILIVLIILWLVIAAWHDRDRLKRSASGLIFFGLVAAATVMPLALFYFEFPQELVAPLNRVTILNDWLTITVEGRGLPAWRILLEQFALGFGAYVFVPLRHWYLPEVPMLRTVPAVFFMAGLVFLFFTRPKKFNLMLLLWLIAYSIIGALSESTPASQRYPASAPAAAMLVAIGVGESARFLTKIWPKTQKIAWMSILTIGLLMAASEAYFYFFEYTPKSVTDLAQTNSMIGYRMGLYLDQRQDHPQIYFLGAPAMGFYSIPSTQYLAPDFKDGIDVNFPWGDAQNPPVEGDHLLFIVLPFLEEDLAAIRDEYPGGKITVQYSTDNQPLFYIYEYKRSP
jgi:4-amino-4-deoxy-L-arabinose transferase-like glycosyltransferase